MSTKTNPNFEKSLAELNSIVEKMETSELELEESLRLFEKGVKLINISQQALKQAEQKVEILCKKNCTETLEPFDSEDTSD